MRSVLMAGALVASAALAAPDAGSQRQSYERAYGHALRCYFANGAIKDEAAGQRSFDAVVKVGRLLGYENRRLNTDLGDRLDLLKMVQNGAYLDQVLAECQRLGLANVRPRGSVAPR